MVASPTGPGLRLPTGRGGSDGAADNGIVVASANGEAAMTGYTSARMPCSFGPPPPPQVRDVRPAYWRLCSDRDCPLDTADDRCLWHAGGTAGMTTMTGQHVLDLSQIAS